MMPHPKSPLILVVDDEYKVARITAAILQAAGFDTRTAQNAQEATEICAALPAVPSLLVADVIMPGTSGPELFLELAAAYDLKRCLFISGFPAESLGQLQGLEHRMLSKPFSPAALVEAVNQMLDPSNRTANLLEQQLRSRAESPE